MSIGRKITVYVLLIALLIAAPASYFFYRLELEEESERFSSLGEKISAATEVALTNYMVFTKDITILRDTIDTLKDIEPISGIWLINREGKVVVSSDSGMIGIKFPYSLEYNVDSNAGKSGGSFLEKDNTFRWIRPIVNRPVCFNCHTSDVSYLGGIVVDFSLDDLRNHVKRDVIRGYMIFLPSLIFVGISIILLSRVAINKRLQSVIVKVKGVKEGTYGKIIKVEGNDEITSLEEAFNTMTEGLNRKDREREYLFKQVSRSFEMWESTFDSITDLISVQDMDYNIVMANSAFLEYFGLSRDDIKNKKCYELFHRSTTPITGCPHEGTLNCGCPVAGEFLEPGTSRVFQISTFPYHFPEADFKGTIHVAKDITEEKENEMRLIMSERLAALGQMASGVAHEINNPLASIAGCAEGLLNRVRKRNFDPRLFEDYLNIVNEEVMRCKNITTNMLSFVRQPSYREDIQINKTIERTLQIINFQGRLKKVELIKEFSEELPIVKGSEGDLKQVFMAIITNALDAIEDRGTVILQTGDEGDNVFVNVIDSGLGIPRSNKDRIFMPFYSTKTELGGTGLGLSIARKVVTKFKGDIQVVSEEGKGATFKIILPVGQ